MIGIVAEFNPYHEGHKYLIDQARLQIGDEPIVVCMSGDFVQRGEPAIRDKFYRAKFTDADLIIELPLPWSLSSAEGFARGAVGILREFGCSHLAFGTECGCIDDLKKIRVDNNEIKEYMKANPELSWPAARSKIINSDILNYPNNTLAFEYLKFIGDMKPFTVKRTTVHDGVFSAKDLRSKMIGPDLEKQIVSRLKMFNKDYYCNLPDSENGVGIRLYNSVGKYSALDDIYKDAKTKRITESAIRRLAMCAALGIEKGMNDNIPPYARILYANSRGCEELKKSHNIPVINKPKEINYLSEYSQKVFAAGASAHDFYNLGFSEKALIERGSDYKTGPFIVNNVQ